MPLATCAGVVHFRQTPCPIGGPCPFRSVGSGKFVRRAWRGEVEEAGMTGLHNESHYTST